MNLWENAINGLSEATIARHIEESESIKNQAEPRWGWRRLLPFVGLAACLALLIWGIPWMHERLQTPPAWESYNYRAIWEEASQQAEMEMALMQSYRTRLTGSPYEIYVPTKVTDPALVGEKLTDVTAQGAWVYYGINPDTGSNVPLREPDPAETESFRGEIFTITGVDPARAVCARFLDKGEALTTEHYYTFLNPALEAGDLQAFWEGFAAAERLKINWDDTYTRAFLEQIKGDDVVRNAYYVSEDQAGKLRTMLLSLKGERATEEAEDLFVGCRKRLTLGMDLAGGFEGEIILYESGFLRFIVNDVHYTPQTPLLYRVGREKVAEILQLVETQSRAYEPDEYATITATTAPSQ